MTSREQPRPRVCVLTSVHPPFDTRVFHRQARSMAAAGFDVLLVAPGAPRDPIDGVRFSSLPTWGGRAGRPLRWPILLFKALRERAAIYHFHDPELLPWGLLLHWLTRQPVIYDAHEYLKEDILTKHWVPARARGPVSAAADRVEKWIGAHLSAVVAVTDEMAGRFLRVQPRTITVKNLAPAATGAEPPPGPRQPVVAYAGLMSAERGLDILHETARLVRERVPNAEFHILGTLFWEGIPDEKQPPSWWEAVGVRFLGTVPQPEVTAFLAGASIGWLPRNPDIPNNLLAWPTKLVEYMVAGLPVVVSDLPLQAAAVAEAHCGIVVEPLSPAAHAAAIIELLTNPALAGELGENGWRAAKQYTWEAEAAKLEALYLQLVPAPRAGPV